MALLIAIVLYALLAFSGWRIYTRAGFKGYIGLLFIIPVVNFFPLFYLAYKDWPACIKIDAPKAEKA